MYLEIRIIHLNHFVNYLNKNIVLLSGDKDSSITIIDKVDYFNKINNMILSYTKKLYIIRVNCERMIDISSEIEVINDWVGKDEIIELLK